MRSRRRRHLGHLAAALLLGSAGRLAAAQASPRSDVPDTAAAGQETDLVVGEIGARVHALLTRYEEYEYSGAVLVAVRDTIVLRHGYGWANREAGIRNTAATRFEVASITKTLTGAAVLRLADEGRMSTADRIEVYLGPFPPAKAEATIEHLATHRAGLALRGTDVGATSRDEFVEKMREAPIESPPGEQYRYTNAGTSLLAAVVEVVSEIPFEQFVTRELLEPIGAAENGFRDTEMPELAKGYLGDPTSLREAPPETYRWGDRGATGWIATVSDLHRWFDGLYGSKVLDPATTARLFAAKPEETYGWHSDASSPWGGPAIHKGGDNGAFTSQIVYLPEERVFLAWTSNNQRQRWRTQLSDGLIALVRGEEVRLPPALRHLGGERLSAYAGVFASKTGTARVCVGEGGLYAAANQSGLLAETLFRPTGGREFTALHPDRLGTVTLQFSGDAQPESLTYRDGARTVTASSVDAPEEAATCLASDGANR